MYSVLSLMSFNPLPRAYLHLSKDSSTCTLLSLHTATTTTTTTTISSTKSMVHGDSYLTSSVSLSIHHNCKQERDQSWSLMQSYTNLGTLRHTYLAPLLCLATLVHVLYHFHILLCHSRFLHTMPYMSSLGTLLYDFKKSTNTQLSSFCPSLYFLLRFSKVWSLHGVWLMCIDKLSVCFFSVVLFRLYI